MKRLTKRFTGIILIITIVVVVGIVGYFTLIKKVSLGDFGGLTQSAQVSETKLGTIPPNADVINFVISPDANHFVYRAQQGSKFFAVYDGNAGKYYANVYDFVFSPDSKQLAYYAVEEGGKEIIVLNGEEGKIYEGVSSSSSGYPLHFNLNGELIYLAVDNGKRFVVINDKEGQKYEASSGYTPSPDGKGFSYQGKSGTGERMIVSDRDGKVHTGKTYRDLCCVSLSWSPRGEHFAYTASDDLNNFAIIDGEEQSHKYDLIHDFIWSSDGKEVAYVAAHSSGQQVIVLNGTESPGYNLISSPTFSMDGKQFAYGAYDKSNEAYIVLNGKEGPRYNHVSGLMFSPDGKQFAYVAKQGRNIIVVVNGEEKARYDLLFSGGYGYKNPSLIFSQDSKNIAFLGHEGGNERGKYFVVLDGRNGKKYDKVYLTPDSFNPDGKFFTYVAISGTDVVRVTNSL